MAKYTSGRQKNLKVGLSSYSENLTSLEVIGKVGIGTTNATSSLYVVGDEYVTGVVTATRFYGDGSNLTAVVATSSGISTYATYAAIAGIATYATIAGYSTSSGIATYAPNAGIATYAPNAGIATYATNAGIATYATNAGFSTYATSSGIATYATSSGIATYATSSGIATYATSSGISTYATIAGYSTSSGISTYATSAGISTYATNSGIATYAPNSGIATQATKFQNSRTFEITGDIVGSPISFDGTGNVSIAATIQPNSVALGSDTTGDYVQSITGTANQISVSVTSGESSTPVISIPSNPTLPGNVTIGNDLQVNRNLNVTGNIMIGGTSAYVIVNDFRVSDKDIILGFTTNISGADVSNDTTANHGGIAIASTEGSPLVNLNIAGIETLPPTYKKIMWFKAGAFAGLNTDAWLTNYAFGVGTTQMPTGARFAAGNFVVGQDDISAVRNINSTGIITATSFVGPLTGNAATATYAQSAGIATYATSSGIATYATNAGVSTYATSSGISTYATSSGIATYATNAGIATYATNSGLSTYATNAGVSTYATSSGIATYATNAGISTYATSSGIATYATNAGISTYATSSGISTYATSSGIATYATNAGLSTYATNAGISTYATSSGIATYATNAGLSTYATNAGVSTNVIGGIASVTQLYVSSGIATVGFITASNIYSSGVVTATSFYGSGANLTGITATAAFLISSDTTNQSQYLTYALGTGSTIGLGVTTKGLVFNPSSGNLGIGSTNPGSKLDVIGDVYVSGVVTATTFYGSAAGLTNLPPSSESIYGKTLAAKYGMFMP